MKHIKSSFLFSSGFAGGLLTAWILSSYRKPDAFRHQKEHATVAIAKINSILKDGTKRLRAINERVKKEFTHPIPDLYRATESLSLGEEELIYD